MKKILFLLALPFITFIYANSIERIESINPMELYEMDKLAWEKDNPYLKPLGYMSYNAWLRLQDEKLQNCKKLENCEEMFDRRHQEWVHYMNSTENCTPKSWYDSDEGRKENN